MYAHILFKYTHGQTMHPLYILNIALRFDLGKGSSMYHVGVPLILKISKEVEDTAQNADPFFIVIVSQL